MSFLGSNSDFRITTQNSKFSVINSKIGMTTIAGESYILSQLEKNCGKYLIMTGLGINYQQMLEVNLCDYLISEAKIPVFIRQLSD